MNKLCVYVCSCSNDLKEIYCSKIYMTIFEEAIGIHFVISKPLNYLIMNESIFLCEVNLAHLKNNITFPERNTLIQRQDTRPQK